MKKLFFLLAASLLTLNMMAQEKFSFVIQGSENMYNQVRVVNQTSLPDIRCRVVVLDDNDRILSVYGTYDLKGSGDSDTNTSRISRGTKLGLQFPDDFDHELLYTVEYRDYPLFDAIDIILYDKNSDFNSEF